MFLCGLENAKFFSISVIDTWKGLIGSFDGDQRGNHCTCMKSEDLLKASAYLGHWSTWRKELVAKKSQEEEQLEDMNYLEDEPLFKLYD